MLRAKKIQTLEQVLDNIELVTAWIESKAQQGDFKALESDRIKGALEVLEHAAYLMECVAQAQN